jgi:putative transposase
MDERRCLLVFIGAAEDGKKELAALEGGFRESGLSWMNLLPDLGKQGLKQGPKPAAGDGAPGFWKALRKVYPQTRQQRCWVHKTADILNKLPKSLQPAAKQNIHAVWMAENRKEAEENCKKFRPVRMV